MLKRRPFQVPRPAKTIDVSSKITLSKFPRRVSEMTPKGLHSGCLLGSKILKSLPKQPQAPNGALASFFCIHCWSLFRGLLPGAPPGASRDGFGRIWSRFWKDFRHFFEESPMHFSDAGSLQNVRICILKGIRRWHAAWRLR